MKLAFFVSLTVYLLTSLTIAHAVPLDGSWSGGGYVKPKSGDREKVRCKISYNKQTDKVYGVNAVCATSAGKISQTGNVLKIRKNRYVGDFANDQYDISGRIEVTIRGKRQTVTLKSGRGFGKLSLRKRR